MKFKVSNILLLFIVTFLMSGCVKWENGIQIPSEDEIKRNQNYTVFIDNSEVIKQENEMIQEYANIFRKGFKTSDKLLIDKNFSKNFKIPKSDNFFQIITPANEIYLSKLDFVTHKELNKYSTFVSNESMVKLDFEIKDRKLISKKKYNNVSEVYSDALRCSLVKQSKDFLELNKKYGFNDFIVDAREFNNNKLVLIPITKFFSLKDKVESHLKSMRFNITQDKSKATDIINLEILAFTTAEKLSEVKKSSTLISNYNDTRIANSAMNATRLSGANSSISAGVGAALLLFNVFSSPDKDKQYIIVPLVSKEKNGETIILKPKPLSFGSIYNLNYLYKFNKKEFDRSYETFSSTFEYFIRKDKGINTYDRIISE